MCKGKISVSKILENHPCRMHRGPFAPPGGGNFHWGNFKVFYVIVIEN